jgi:hypothetical protein
MFSELVYFSKIYNMLIMAKDSLKTTVFQASSNCSKIMVKSQNFCFKFIKLMTLSRSKFHRHFPVACPRHHKLQRFSKSKVFPVQFMKTYRGSRCIAPLILNFGVYGGQRPNSLPGRCTLGKQS